MGLGIVEDHRHVLVPEEEIRLGGVLAHESDDREFLRREFVIRVLPRHPHGKLIKYLARNFDNDAVVLLLRAARNVQLLALDEVVSREANQQILALAVLGLERLGAHVRELLVEKAKGLYLEVLFDSFKQPERFAIADDLIGGLVVRLLLALVLYRGWKLAFCQAYVGYRSVRCMTGNL